MANNNNDNKNNKPTSKDGLRNTYLAAHNGPLNVSEGLNTIFNTIGGIPNALGNIGNNIINGLEAAAPNLMYQPGQKNIWQQAIAYDQQKAAEKEAQKAQPVQQTPSNITPQQKAAFDAMMAEKAAGGSGNIAANQYGLQLPGRNSNVDENVAASKDAGEEIMAPTEGLTFDNSGDDNIVSTTTATNATAETVDNSNAPLLRGTAPTGNITGAASNVDNSTDEIIKQLMSTEGQITPQQMQEMIKGYYADARNIVNQNPLYGGDYVQPGGYQIDPNELSRRQAEDEVLRRTSIYGGGPTYTGNLAQNYVDNQRQMYNAQMANRAGVPYEDYVKGMAERNAQDVLLRAKEVEQQLTNYANQSNDMKTKLQVVQALQINKQNTQAKLDEIYANYIKDSNLEKIKADNEIRKQFLVNQGNLNVRNAQDVADLVKTQYQMNHPSTMYKSVGSFLGSGALAFWQNSQGLANFLAALSPQYHKALFGKVMNPNDINDIFTAQQAIQNNPSAFAEFLNRYNILNQGQ